MIIFYPMDMSQRIGLKIVFKDVGEVEAILDPQLNPHTVESVVKALPIKGRANRWGDEIYFSTSIKAGEENAREEVDVGDIGYWPPGNALCIFFGSTPASTGSKPRAASPVNVIGRVISELDMLQKVRNGCEVSIRRA